MTVPSAVPVAEQLDLDAAARRIGPWRAGQADTARLAAIANLPAKADQARQVIRYLATVVDATAHEVAAACPLIPWPHTASTRMAEMAPDGKVADRVGYALVCRTGRRRPVQPSGRLAITWALTREGQALAAHLGDKA